MRRTLRQPTRPTSFVGVVLIVMLWVGVIGLYRAVSILEWNALWDHQPRALQAYTRVADTRYTEAFQRAQSTALHHGWFIPDHDLRQTTQSFDIWYVRWKASHIASINARRLEIILDDRRMSTMNDDELECVMAHEIGHSVDYRYGRERDMYLWPYRCETREAFADAVGSMLCGRTRYWRFYRKYIEHRFGDQGSCEAVSTPVTE